MFHFLSHVYSPRTASGRPLSGMQRPESRLKTGSMEQMLRTSRTSKTARPISASTARQARLGTVNFVKVNWLIFSKGFNARKIRKCLHKFGETECSQIRKRQIS